jgi:hypothetical protein
MEGYLGILTRGTNAVYHHAAQQHLHQYLTELDYRYNTRKQTDSVRTIEALKKLKGKAAHAEGPTPAELSWKGEYFKKRKRE